MVVLYVSYCKNVRKSDRSITQGVLACGILLPGFRIIYQKGEHLHGLVHFWILWYYNLLSM